MADYFYDNQQEANVNQLAYVYWQLDATDSRPTDGQKERVGDLEKEIDLQLAKLKSILQTDVDAFNKLASSSGAMPVMIE